MANVTLANLGTAENLFSDLTVIELESTNGGETNAGGDLLSTLVGTTASGLVSVAASVPVTVSNVLNNSSVLSGNSVSVL